MLILSRREAESVCLGDNIVLTIVAVGNDKVRVGVKAPPGVRILRNELEVEVSTLPLLGTGMIELPLASTSVEVPDCESGPQPVVDSAGEAADVRVTAERASGEVADKTPPLRALLLKANKQGVPLPRPANVPAQVTDGVRKAA